MVTSINRKVKIAMVITRMDWAGAPDIVRILCECLDPLKYDITVIIGKTAYPSKKTELFFKRFSKNIISVPFLVRNINPALDLLALARLCRIFKRGAFDIFYGHTAKSFFLGR